MLNEKGIKTHYICNVTDSLRNRYSLAVSALRSCLMNVIYKGFQDRQPKAKEKSS